MFFCCNSQWSSPEHIRSRFEKYGGVRKFEIHPEKYPRCIGIEEQYAYVTYFDSMSAHRAVCDDKKIRRDMRIIPADTWKQPKAKMGPLNIAQNEENSLSRLNEDCLIEIFEQLDLQSLINLSQLCDRLSDIIRRRIFPSLRKVALSYDPKRTVGDSVDTSWNIVKNILHYGTEVELETNSYIEYPNMDRFADIFTRNLNENLERLALIGVLITDRMHRQLRPVFWRLSAFEWHYHSVTSDICAVNLVQWCPALKELTLRGNIDFSYNLYPWKSLESASLLIPIDREGILKFVLNNQHLRSIEFIMDNYMLLNDVQIHLPYLESLKISGRSLTVYSIFHLLANTRLKSLRLVAAEFRNSNVDSRRPLTTLERLELISVHGCEFWHDFCLSDLTGILPNLKIFCIRRKKLPPIALLNFLVYASQLNVFQFSLCELHLDDDLLEAIANIRKIQSRKLRTAVRPLTIFVDDEDDHESLSDVDRIVTVHYLPKCNSFRFA